MRDQIARVLAFLTFSLVSATALRAEWTDDAQKCYVGGVGSTTENIRYCTQALEGGKLTPEELAKTYINRSVKYGNRGDIELQLADINAAIRVNPNSLQAYSARGAYYRAHGEETKAVADFNKVLALPVSGNDGGQYVSRARGYYRLGKTTEALNELDTAFRLDPKIREIFMLRAAIYSGRDDYQRAIDSYNAALALTPNDTNLLASRAAMYNGVGDFKAALNDCDAVIALEPSVADRYAARAFTYRNLGNNDAAIDDYTRAIRLEPDRSLRYTARAITYRAKGDWVSAMRDYGAATKAEPDRARYWGSRAEAYEARGDYQAAIADRTEAVRLEPKDADWRTARAWTLLYAGLTDQALADFGAAIAMDAGGANRYDARGNAFLLLNRFDEARRDFERAIELQPTQGVHYAWRGFVSIYRGEPTSALQDIDHAGAVDRNYDVDSMRGFVGLLTGDLDASIQNYSKYIAIRPNASSAFSSRGLAKMLKGDLRGAVDDYRQALHYNVWSSSAHLWLFVARARLGENARVELADAAKRFDPTVWPGAAFKALQGQISVQDMIAAAHDPSPIKKRGRETEAYFLAGQYYLGLNQVSKAKTMFAEAVKRSVPYSQYFAAAKAQLAQLSKP